MKPVCFANLKKIAPFSVVGFHPTKIFVHSNEIIFHLIIYFWRWTVHSYDRNNTKWDILGIFLFSMKIISQAIKCFGFNGH